MITSSSYDVDVDSLFHNLSWKELHSQRQIQKALTVFKSLNGLAPEYLTSKFVTRNVSNYALRDSANKLVVPFPRINYMKNSFSYSGATLWNSLPYNIRACLHGGGGPQVGEVTRLAVVEKWPALTCKLTTPGSRGDFTRRCCVIDDR